MKLKVVHVEVARKHFKPRKDTEEFVHSLSLVEELMPGRCVSCTEKGSAHDIYCELKDSLSKATSRNAVQNVEIKSKVHHKYEVQRYFEARVLLKLLLRLLAHIFIVNWQKTVNKRHQDEG